MKSVTQQPPDPCCWPESAVGLVAPVALLLVGYEGTDLTTFASELAAGTVGHKHKWVSYSASTRSVLELVGLFKGAVVTSFDSAVEAAVRAELGIPGDVDLSTKQFDTVDARGIETPLFKYVQKVKDAATVRDAGHWAKKALLPHFVPLGKPRAAVVCMGLTKYYEYMDSRNAGADVLTARIYKADAPVPPVDDWRAHNLDELVTDFLLVPSEDDLSGAMLQFPNYAWHTKDGEVEWDPELKQVMNELRRNYGMNPFEDL